MVAARIATAIVLAGVLSVASAQEVTQTQVTVLVKDTSGGIIPGAHIQIDPSPSAIQNPVITDHTGLAVINLPDGPHRLRVSAVGFLSAELSFNAQENPEKLITAGLALDPSYYGGYQGPSRSGPLTIPPELDVKPAAAADFIPLKDLNSLDPLPTHRAKKHWW